MGTTAASWKRDPDFTDAYQVPGVYDYGIATLPRALRMLAFLSGVRGDKERGLDWLARTAQEGERSRWGALWAQVLFMQREDRLEEALVAIRTLREQFPKNPDYALEELAACGKTHAAFDRRCIPAEPLRFAPFCVAFRSKYTGYSSLTRLVSRAPHRSRRSRGFHHRLLGVHLHHGETAEARDEVLAFIEQRDAGFGNYHLTPGGLPELRLGESWLFEEKWEEAEAAFSRGLESSPPSDICVMLHFRRGNARDGMGQRQRALFDYNRVRQIGGDKVVEGWAKDLRKRPWPANAPEGSRPHPEGSRPH